MIEKIDGGENENDEELLLMNMSLARTNSVRSRGTHTLNQSKSHEFSNLARKYED